MVEKRWLLYSVDNNTYLGENGVWVADRTEALRLDDESYLYNTLADTITPLGEFRGEELYVKTENFEKNAKSGKK